MKKRKYTHIKELEPILLQMREDGASRREIAGELGLSLKQVESLITRYNKQKAAITQGVLRRPKGRPRTRPMTKEEEYQREIARLEMENKLLRDFLQSTERK